MRHMQYRSSTPKHKGHRVIRVETAEMVAFDITIVIYMFRLAGEYTTVKIPLSPFM
jgi:hypothetical protein